MYRSTWELTTYVRHHIADLADDRRVCSRIDGNEHRPEHMLTQARHRVGIGLIKLGQALAGFDTVRGLPAAPARPATWGSGS